MEWKKSGRVAPAVVDTEAGAGRPRAHRVAGARGTGGHHPGVRQCSGAAGGVAGGSFSEFARPESGAVSIPESK